jgi:hypothetical protein
MPIDAYISGKEAMINDAERNPAADIKDPPLDIGGGHLDTFS